MGIKLEVPVDVSSAYVRGRNGYFAITAVRIRQWGAERLDGNVAVDIEAIGKRGKAIKGGFACLHTNEIDALCKAWIEARGGLAILPGDDDVGAVVNTSAGIVESVVVGRELDQLHVAGADYIGFRDPDSYQYRLEWVEMVAGQNLLLVPVAAARLDLDL